MPRYITTDGKFYNIPDDVVADFERDNPDAKVEYEDNGEVYQIPISEREGFLSVFPNASLVEKQIAKPQELATPMSEQYNVAPEPSKGQEKFGLDSGIPSITETAKGIVEGHRVTPTFSIENQPQEITTFGEGVKQGKEQLVAGAQYGIGEAAASVLGTSRDDIEALAEIERLQAEGKDVAEETKNVTDLSAVSPIVKKGLELMGAGKAIGEAEKITQRNRTIQKALKENEGDVDKAKEWLESRAGKQTWADEMMADATYKMAQAKPTKGWGWVGSMIPQMVGTGVGLAASMVFKSPLPAQILGGTNMAGLTLSTAGQAMADARQAGASNSQVWTSGIINGAVELLTEKIPYNRYVGRITDAAKNGAKQALGKAVTEVGSTANKELKDLLNKANKRLDGKLFSGKNIEDYMGDLVAEGISEATAEGLQTIIPIIYENPENYPTFMEILGNALEGAKGGIFMGAFLGGASKAAEHRMNRARRKAQGYVDVAEVTTPDGKDEIVEVVRNEQDQPVFYWNGQEIPILDKDVKQRHQFNFEDFERGQFQLEQDEAYENGRTLETQQEMNDAANMLKKQAEKVRVLYGLKEDEDVDAFLGENPLQVALDERETDEEAGQIILDYLNAKSTVDGVVEGAQDRIEEETLKATAIIDSRKSETDGLIHPAKMKVDDRQVYVVSGNIALLDDGTINSADSDESIIVMDAVTGKREFTTAKDLLSADTALDPEVEKQNVRATISDTISTEVASKLEGVLPFNIGDTYPVMDNDGNAHNVQVVAVDDQNTIQVIMDNEAQPTTVTKDIIQQMSNAYNLNRAAQFEQGRQEEREAEKMKQEAEQVVEPTNMVEQTTEAPAEVVPERVVPTLKDGNPDFNAMDAEMFVDEYVSRYGEDSATKIARKNISNARENIAKIDKKIDDITDPNQMEGLYSQRNALEAQIARYSEILDRLGASEDANETEADQRNRLRNDAGNRITTLFPDGMPNVESFILADIATGNRIRWSDKVTNGVVTSRGLGAELGLSDSKQERTRRLPLIGKDAMTPEEYAESLRERLDAVGIRYDESSLRDAVLGVYQSVDSRKGAWYALENMSKKMQEPQTDMDWEDMQQQMAYNKAQNDDAPALPDMPDLASIEEETPISENENAEMEAQAQEGKQSDYDAMMDEFEGEFRPKYMNLSKEEVDIVLDAMKIGAEIEPAAIELTPENWTSEFGDNGILSTPIGDVKMGEGQYLKLMQRKREKYFSLIKPTLNNPDVVLEEYDPADGAERDTKLLFVKTFVKEDGHRYIHFESVTVQKESKEVSISSHEVNESDLKKKMHNNNVVHLKDSFFDSEGRLIEPQNEGSDLVPTPNVSSESKDTTSKPQKQEVDEKISQEEQKVNVNPTDGQKEAGNYKKGHVVVDGFNITIEQPKGSVRSGVDADGKEWSVTMNNTYGYIRGTEGVDGDHIDVFLSDNLDNWGGEVFVVDQINTDGSFDEHKVMYGFNSIEEAQQAYLSNYSEGWQGLGAITGISKDEFKKWIASSHRKTKPFAEYKSVKATEGQSAESVEATDDEQILFRRGEKSVQEEVTETIFATAKEKFGTTYDMREAGYILPDGSMLDFSGKHEIRGADTSFLNGQRSVDHRAIQEIAYDFDENKTGVETDMGDFLDRGAIRIDYNTGAINLNVAPTKAQKDRLKRLIERNDGDVYIDFGKGWDTEHYVEYESARASRVLGDIDRYFNEGIKPSGNIRFRSAESAQIVPVFYSNAEYAVKAVKQEKATPEQWLKMIEKNGGLKAGEDKWLGLSDWLKSSDKKTLTKQEVLDFIKENQIQIEEVEYGDLRNTSRFKELEKEYQSHYAETYDTGESFKRMVDKYGDDFDLAFSASGMNLYINDMYGTEAADSFLDARDINDTRIQYTTDGLDNKREIALTVPAIESWNESDEIHFGDAGNGRAIAWVRFGETTDADGNRVLVIDEVQSKRHQEGREKGYNNPRVIEIFTRLADIESNLYSPQGLSMEMQSEREALKAELESIFENDNPVMKSIAEQLDEKESKRTALLRERLEREDDERVEILKLQAKQDKVRNNRDYDYYESEIDKIKERIDQRSEELDLLASDIIDLNLEYSRYYNTEIRNARIGVSPAPFEKNWAELAMKRMLRYAAENGFDKIAWTTGEQQAERYNIGNTVDGIDVVPYEAQSASEIDGFDITIRTSNYGERIELFTDSKGEIQSGEIGGSSVAGKHLSDILGKSLANKIISNEGGVITDVEKSDSAKRAEYASAVMQMMSKYNVSRPTDLQRVISENDKATLDALDPSYVVSARTYSGDGLRIGNEGMKAFYDQMIPSFMNKYGKKWGVKVGEVTMPSLEENNTMHSIDVTDAMRESVMQGQPMFRMSDKTQVKLAGWYEDIAKRYKIQGNIQIAPSREIFEQTLLDNGVAQDKLAEYDKAAYIEDKDIYLINGDGINDNIEAEQVIIHELWHKLTREIVSLQDLKWLAKNIPSSRLNALSNALWTRSYDNPEVAIDELISIIGENYVIAEVDVDGKTISALEAYLNNHISLKEATELAKEALTDVAREYSDIWDKIFYESQRNLLHYKNAYYEQQRESRGGQVSILREAVAEKDSKTDNGISQTVFGGQAQMAMGATPEGVGRNDSATTRAEQRQRAIVAEANDLASSLGVKLNVIEDVNEITDSNTRRQRAKRGAKAWYDVNTDQVYFVAPNATSIADAQESVLHEVVAHKGLRDVVGRENFKKFLDKVYQSAAPEIRAQIIRLAAQNGWNIREATEEYLASLAEQGFDSRENRTFLQKVRDLFMDMLREAKIAIGYNITDNDMRYMLWRTYQMQKSQGAMAVAEDVLMQQKLGVGNFRTRPAGTRSMTEEEQIIADANNDDIRFRIDKEGETATPSSNEPNSETVSKEEKFQKALKSLRKSLKGKKSIRRALAALVASRVRHEVTDDIINVMGKSEFNALVKQVQEADIEADVVKPLERISEIVADLSIKDKEKKIFDLLALKVRGENQSGVSIAKSVDNATRKLFDILAGNIKRPADEIRNAFDGKVDDLILNMALDISEKYRQVTSLMRESDDINAEIKTLKEENTVLRKKRAELNKEGKTDEAKAISKQISKNKEIISALESERLVNKEQTEQMLSYVHRNLYYAAQMGRGLYKTLMYHNMMHKVDMVNMAMRDVDTKQTLSVLTEKPSRREKAKENVRAFLLSPARSLNYLLKRITVNAPYGEGQLYDYFIRGKNGYIAAAEKFYNGYNEFKDELNNKTKSVFGKPYKEVLAESNNPSNATIAVTAGSRVQDVQLTIGQAMYLYMVNKMADGKVKLAKMGIFDEDVERVKDSLPTKYIAFADWLQNEFLPEKREKYNETHIKIFGTDMASIDNYVPMKNKRDEVYQEFDGTEQDEDRLPTTITGSIINRKRNNVILDLTTNALDLMLTHGEEMEHWNAYTPVVRDMNELLSNTKFKLVLDNRSRGLTQDLKVAARIASGQYSPEVDRFSKAWAIASKGIVASKIAFRVWTAIKQMLSFPAFVAYSSSASYHKQLAKSLIHPIDAWKWGMDNLPILHKRWNSRSLGNEKLSEITESTLGKILDGTAKVGMIPNAFVDALTCAIGAKAVYDYKVKEYQAQMYSLEEAKYRALIDATVSFNESQQSNEGLFLSQIQSNRDGLSVMVSTFNNQTFGYLRKTLEAGRELMRRRDAEIEYLRDMYINQGMNYDDAERMAKVDVRKTKRTAVLTLSMYGFLLNTIWVAGSNVFKYIFDDDDDEELKNDMFAALAIAPVRNTTVGSWVESAAQGYDVNPSILLSDLNTLKERLTADEPVRWDKTVAYMALKVASSMTTGVDLETLVRLYEGIDGMITDGVDVEDIMALISAPRSQALLTAREPKENETLPEYLNRIAKIERRIDSRISDSVRSVWVKNYYMYQLANEFNLSTKRDDFGRVSIPEYENIIDEAKITSDREKSYAKNKIPKSDMEAFKELPEYKRMEITKKYKKDIDKILKTLKGDITEDERAKQEKMLLDKMRNLLDELDLLSNK